MVLDDLYGLKLSVSMYSEIDFDHLDIGHKVILWQESSHVIHSSSHPPHRPLYHFTQTILLFAP